MLQESGEHVLITAGEVHLQRCLRDLTENYAKIKINASQPIVPFRETILAPLESETIGRIQITTPGKRFSMQLRAVSLPEKVTTHLENNIDIIKNMRQARCGSESLELMMAELHIEDLLSLQMRKKVAKLYDQLDEAFQAANWGML